MIERITIASPDPVFAAWLEQFVGTLRPYTALRTADFGTIDQPQRPGDDGCDVLLLHASFASGDARDAGGVASGESQGLAMLRRLRPAADRPVIVAIAEQGNELTAVSALRNGAEDYLPRALLTPDRLHRALGHAMQVAERRAAFLRRGRTVPAAADAGAAGVDLIADADDAAIDPADGIPRYQVLRLLGRSAGATVYLATAADLEQNVALKISTEATLGDPRAREQLAREYQTLASISHPSIIDIYDYGVHNGREYLAMEYFPRGDLHARMHSEPVQAGAAIAYAARIAEALQVVHAAGIVHSSHRTSCCARTTASC
jgi:DNA-binding NarL/FixJ family response regulator